MSEALDRWLPVMTQRIVEQFDPLRIILFGSWARGDAEDDSDIDLLVVMPDGTERRRTAIEIEDAFDGLRDEAGQLVAPSDVLVTTPGDIAARGHLPGTVLRPALREGVVVYMKDESLKPHVSTWWTHAEGDLAAAEMLWEARVGLPSIVGFHAQQAAEKALKACLIAAGLQDIPRTHQLATCRNLLPADWRRPVERLELGRLSEFAVERRYPDDPDTPSWEEVQSALATARQLMVALRSELRSRDWLPSDEA